MSDYTQDSARAGIAGLVLIIIVVAVLALALTGWITDNIAERSRAQVRIEAERQAGQTERAEVFGLTLASITAMGTASGVMPLAVGGLLVAVLAGEAYIIWRQTGGRK